MAGSASGFIGPAVNAFKDVASGSSSSGNSSGGSSSSTASAPSPVPVPQAQYYTAGPDFNQLAAQNMQSAAGMARAGAMTNMQGMDATRAGMQGTTAGMRGTASGMNFYSPMYADTYMNPYQQNVIGGLRQEAGRNYDMMSNQIGSEASRAGAFGGSRHGVAQGTAAGDIQRGLNQQIGQLQYQGYNDALNRAAQDQQMRMSAAAQMGALGQGLSGQGVSLSGQGATLTNQGSALSGIGQGMYDMSRQANLDMQQAGLQQQAIQQAIIDAGKGQYAGFTGAPAAALSYLGQALGGAAGMVPQTTTNTKNAGLFDYLTLGAMLK